MRHTRRKERDGLDLARPAPRRRHKTLRQLCALLLGLAGLALLSMAVWGAALPRRLDDALAQHYAAQMSVMQRELFALRRRLAEREPDAEENAALLVRNETDSLLLKDVSADVFDSLQDADTLMVCELSRTENEKETEIVHAYEAEISD